MDVVRLFFFLKVGAKLFGRQWEGKASLEAKVWIYRSWEWRKVDCRANFHHSINLEVLRGRDECREGQGRLRVEEVICQAIFSSLPAASRLNNISGCWSGGDNKVRHRVEGKEKVTNIGDRNIKGLVHAERVKFRGTASGQPATQLREVRNCSYRI